MMSNKLIDEYPVLVLPSLAVALGLNEAIVLQQVHYWITTFQKADQPRHYRDGRWWVYNTYENWQTNFPWWSTRTIERILTRLRDRGVLLATDEYNQTKYDRTLWYAIDYEALESLTPSCGEGLTTASRAQGRQAVRLEHDNLSSPIPETNTETNPQIPPSGGKAEKGEKSLHHMKPSPREAKKNQKQTPPIGGNDAFVVHDLEDVVYYTEGSGWKKDDLTALCPHCGAVHDQETNTCPDCGALVVWQNSPVWRRLYGRPRDAIRAARGEDLKAATPLEIEFCRAFNRRARFANVTQQREFRRLARKYPDAYLRELMEWAAGKGFQALKSAAENPDNLNKWGNKNGVPQEEEERVEEHDPWAFMIELHEQNKKSEPLTREQMRAIFFGEEAGDGTERQRAGAAEH